MAPVILLDTQVLIWYMTDMSQLGSRAASVVNQAWSNHEAAVSAITFWEIGMIRSKNRLGMTFDLQSWRRELIESGLTEIPVDGVIGIRAGLLPDLHGDPADRIIVATALDGHQLVTADRRILAWSGRLERIDARR